MHEWPDNFAPEWIKQQREVAGFDLELVGYDCRADLEFDDPKVCPFNPGCGMELADCPLKKQLGRIARAPGRKQ